MEPKISPEERASEREEDERTFAIALACNAGFAIRRALDDTDACGRASRAHHPTRDAAGRAELGTS